MNNAVIRRLIVALVLLTGVGLAMIFREQLELAQLEHQLDSLGWLAPLFFIFIYSLATVLLVPGLVLTLAAGAIFGPYLGTLYTIIAATTGATLSFLIAHYLGAGWIRNKLGDRMEGIIIGVEKEGWRFVAFTRLVPLFPFNLLNYALGLTRIPLGQYIVASFVFMLPGSFVYNWLGYTGRDIIAGDGSAMKNIFIAVSLLLALLFLPRIVKSMRNKTNQSANNY